LSRLYNHNAESACLANSSRCDSVAQTPPSCWVDRRSWALPKSVISIRKSRSETVKSRGVCIDRAVLIA
tara:strand:- start:38992 stop:39198 length:207 start_codon:yes stop_codon:yes gene_type:complete